VDGFAGLEREDFGALLKCLFVVLVAMSGGGNFHRFFRNQAAVMIVKDVDKFVALDLDEDILFRIEMERCRRIGR
jgi:hypothetical protein